MFTLTVTRDDEFQSLDFEVVGGPFTLFFYHDLFTLSESVFQTRSANGPKAGTRLELSADYTQVKIDVDYDCNTFTQTLTLTPEAGRSLWSCLERAQRLTQELKSQ